ncbi:MAG: lipase maturation factor family protein [Acidobacteriia bacterium]|nr:lipase maturation factor family protein [Terriglobia bacterium]
MIRAFLRLLGVIYFIAFTSFGVQASGLIGSHGILPYAEYLADMRQALGRSAYWEIPSVLWLHSSDAALAVIWILGAAFALAVIFEFRQRIGLVLCLVLWLSLCAVGQDFLSFQWDVLLLEAGFLAIFVDGSPMRIWLLRWLLFRLMFFSGAGKLLSGDPSWRNLTALSYHYMTQPLPTPAAWLMYQLPLGFHKAETVFVFVAELAAPFLFFAPRRIRHIGAWITIALQLLILTTGNYTFFNLLTIVLCLPLFAEPDRLARTRLHRAVTIALTSFVAITTGLLFFELFGWGLPPGGAAVLHVTSPLRIVNTYGLFTVMTVDRPEIVVEGSDDGENWKAYEFPYKPGDLLRAPPVVEPHQPRLDWQMWFAALSNYQQNPWFQNFMGRLLQGEPAVLRLLAYNPFPKAPPRYVRARVYLYTFTHFGEKGWWHRQDRGLYFPAVSLK